MDFIDLYNVTANPNDPMEMKNKIDKIRKSLCTHDKSLLENKNVHLSFENLSNAPDGRFDISYKEINFECLFKRKENSKKLYVFFSGWRKPNQNEPTFKRWSYYKYFDGSMLNIDDPMCKLYPQLGLGWYYGTADACFCDYLVDIINRFAEQNGYSEIVFISSSAGGYAALYCACKISGSMVIAINPQIKLDIYHYCKSFQHITGLDLSIEDKYGRNHLSKLIKNAEKTKFLLIENCASGVDTPQLDNLCTELGVNYHYGLNSLVPNILLWVYEGKTDKPHNAQEYFPMLYAIKFLAEHFDDAMNYNEIYMIFSELWNEHYELVSKLK